MKKPVRIIIIIALALCAGLLITAIVVMSGGGLAGGNKDSRYPYSWKVKTDGTLEFTMKSQMVAGYTWQVEELPSYVGIEMSPLEQSGDKTVFTITPASGGISNIALNCNNENGLTDMRFNIKVVVDLDTAITDVLVTETDYYIDARGEMENCKYSLYTSDDGGLEIRFSYINEGSYFWRNVADAENAEDILQVQNLVNAKGNGVVKIYTAEYIEKQKNEISSKEQEATQSTLEAQSIALPSSTSQSEPEEIKATTHVANIYGVDANKIKDFQLSITFEYANGKVTKVTSHTIQEVTPLTEVEVLAEEKSQAEKHLGKEIKTIEKSENWQFAMEGTEEDKNQSVLFSFVLDNNTYDYVMTKDKSIAFPEQDNASAWEEGKGKDAAKAPFTSYTNEAAIMLVWQASDGTYCTLSSANTIGLEKLQEVARKL